MTSGTAYEDRLRQLMVRYQAADRAAVEELVRLLSPALLRFLSSPRLPGGDAEDVLQECWLRIHKARHTYRSSEPLLPWIFAIARYTRLDGYRRRRRLESRETLVARVPEYLHPVEPVEISVGEEVFRLLG